MKKLTLLIMVLFALCVVIDAQVEVNPHPDTQIRVYMEYKKHDGKEKLPLQKLPNIVRKGFTLIEWGGGEMNSRTIKSKEFLEACLGVTPIETKGFSR